MLTAQPPIRSICLAILIGSCVLSAGCRHHGNQSDVMTNQSPPELFESAVLVAHTNVVSAPLHYVADREGRVMYAANKQVVSSFPVNEKDVVFLKVGFSDGRIATELTLNGNVIYSTSTRAADNRFYFIEYEDES